jgi:hypothetical protein
MCPFRKVVLLLALISFGTGTSAWGDEKTAAGSWRSLPLIKDSQVNPDWVHLGWGGFVVDGEALRTECDEKGMGLLLYQPEQFGNCQIRIVYKTKDPKSNAGVFVRIDPGILAKVNEKTAPVRRDNNGKVTEESMTQLMKLSAEELGAWYPVHHGYEVQICDDADPYHRTGAIYSLAKAAAQPKAREDGWRTMVITLNGNLVQVKVDDQLITTFDPDDKSVPLERKWFEPKREPKRPITGYIGLQNHDPGDVVYFKEVSVRDLAKEP